MPLAGRPRERPGVSDQHLRRRCPCGRDDDRSGAERDDDDRHAAADGRRDHRPPEAPVRIRAYGQGMGRVRRDARKDSREDGSGTEDDSGNTGPSVLAIHSTVVLLRSCARRSVSSRRRRSRYGESWTTTSSRIRTRLPGRPHSRPAGTETTRYRFCRRRTMVNGRRRSEVTRKRNHCSDSCLAISRPSRTGSRSGSQVSERRSSLQRVRYPRSAISGSTRVARRAGK